MLVNFLHFNSGKSRFHFTGLKRLISFFTGNWLPCYMPVFYALPVPVQ